MRTTIELSDVQRAELLRLAAERGEKGFSRLIQEAVDRYLEEQGSRSDRTEAALRLEGTLDNAGAEALERSVREARSLWR
ncbi:MAG: hypothetical protein M3Y59_16720 [Myxococcota bacterium]|nr:hypothetical protein [Myxococcota bacterium]